MNSRQIARTLRWFSIGTTFLALASFTGCQHRTPLSPSHNDAQYDNAPSIVAEGRLVEIAEKESDAIPGTDYFRFGVPVTVHGHTLLMMADLGTDITLLTSPAFDSIHVPRMFANATRVVTLSRSGGIDPVVDSTATAIVISGDSVNQYWGDDFKPPVLDSLQIGTTVHRQVLVASEIAYGPTRPFDGVLGRELLSQFDLEINMPDGVIRLYPRYVPSREGERPRWVPKGMRTQDCVPVLRTQRPRPDTTDLDDEDKAQMRSKSLQRVFDSQKLVLPLRINGKSINGALDSGADMSFMNTAEGKALRLPMGNSLMPPSVAYGESTYVAKNLDLRLANQPLPTGPVVVRNSFFEKVPEFETKPLFSLGLQHIRNRSVFYSYSTSMVCVGAVQSTKRTQ